jgi:glutamate-5-semialdehyde dehydrogenase
MAARTNERLVAVLRHALEGVGLPADAILAVDASQRTTATEMMGLRGLIDLLIPRGGAGLIASIVENSTVPVIETGTGNCHVYVERTADPAMTRTVVLNAKCQRPSVCNAAESLLIDREVANRMLEILVPALTEAGVELAVDPEYVAFARTLVDDDVSILPATEEDYATEYLDMKMSIKVVEDVVEAVEHINRYGTMHSEAILTSDSDAAGYFTNHVDAAAVYVNASTRFTDGGLFGLGAEIGISTQKMHARGPFALKALTTTKHICRGTGQIRT